jgi:hypothetical protein
MGVSLYFIFATNSVPMSVKLNENAKRPSVIPTLGIKFKIIAETDK